MNNRLSHLAATAAFALALTASPVLAQKKYDPGASDTEIKVGQTNPFSGPASAFASIGGNTDEQPCDQQHNKQ